MTRFVEDGRIELDNNAAARDLPDHAHGARIVRRSRWRCPTLRSHRLLGQNL
ncbi:MULTISPECIES: hypothetical protein [unclassified Bradyrhizobium]|uniref:hypothetical protein n=1 Tax=Bradyrhizobium sp. USDA 4541 TaxID=2817704 RepID=UPI0035C77D30